MSHYLLVYNVLNKVNNDSFEPFTAKFEHSSAIQIQIGNTQDISHDSYKTVKVAFHVEIDKI